MHRSPPGSPHRRVQLPPVTAVPPPVQLAPLDPFAKVRSLGGTLVVMLAIRASVRSATYVAYHVAKPPSGMLTPEQLDSMRMTQAALLGVENLVTIVTMITFFVWIYGVFVAIRRSGGTTSWSPGWAVGGWFVPLANLVIPWLTVRDALKALGYPTVLAGAWWLAWLLLIPLTMLQTMSRQLFIMPELMSALRVVSMDRFIDLFQSTYWPHFVLDTVAWLLLLVIVLTVRKAKAGVPHR